MSTIAPTAATNIQVVRDAPLQGMQRVGASLPAIWSVLLASNICVSVLPGLLGLRSLSETIKPLLTVVAVVLGSFYLLRESNNEERRPIASAIFAMPLMAFASSCALWWGMAKLEMLCAILMTGSFILTTEGRSRFIIWLRPLFLALFLIGDVPDEVKQCLCVPLQYLSCTVAVFLTKFFIPIVQTGHHFMVDGVSYDVAPGCSGLSMWASFLFAFALWQMFLKYRPMAYLVAVVLDPILTLGLNSIRLFITAMVAHFYSVQTAVAIHSNLEYFLVPPGLLVLWYVGARFRAK